MPTTNASAGASKGFRRKNISVGRCGAEHTTSYSPAIRTHPICSRSATALRPQSDRWRSHLPLFLLQKKKTRACLTRARALNVSSRKRTRPPNLGSRPWPLTSSSRRSRNRTGEAGARRKANGWLLSPTVPFRACPASLMLWASGRTRTHGNNRVAGTFPRRRISSSGSTGCENLPSPWSRAETAIRRDPGRLP